ncbi:uncharacterized protein LOC121404896 [Drosophila obscura]|uniref:uncharacterized protein LOC121404896 n=1 Tax=Drosophila obscura TaxID=7282 RepID=UPI001BB1A416|nr:uncharacterized protein LOC121404896 [Drosophila obscura]
MSAEEHSEEHFKQHYSDSYLQAKSRFENLERKFSRNPKVKEQYVPSSQLHECKYFLPHHCVLKEESSSTKLRVVFNGSAVTSSRFSLNALLMSGPTIQAKLFTTLVRFRTFPIGTTGDVCKMYRCARVQEPVSLLQCILWRDSPKDDILVCKLDTVTYGTKPASFLAIRAMQQLAMDGSSSYPLGSKVVLRDFKPF